MCVLAARSALSSVWRDLGDFPLLLPFSQEWKEQYVLESGCCMLVLEGPVREFRQDKIGLDR